MVTAPAFRGFASRCNEPAGPSALPGSASAPCRSARSAGKRVALLQWLRPARMRRRPDFSTRSHFAPGAQLRRASVIPFMEECDEALRLHRFWLRLGDAACRRLQQDRDAGGDHDRSTASETGAGSAIDRLHTSAAASDAARKCAGWRGILRPETGPGERPFESGIQEGGQGRSGEVDRARLGLRGRKGWGSSRARRANGLDLRACVIDRRLPRDSHFVSCDAPCRRALNSHRKSATLKASSRSNCGSLVSNG